MNTTTLPRRLCIAAGAAVAAIFIPAAAITAHDFWLVPNALTFAPGGSVEVLGQSGTKFPTSSGPTQLTQVAEARIVGRSSDQKLGDLSVTGNALMLRHKPSSAGQYVVAVALAARSARTTPARLQRYLELEGAPELAARYAQDGTFPRMDSVTQVSAKFAKTIVEVGAGGPRAFDKAVGHALELIALDDPAQARSGESIRVRLLFHGKPVSNVPLRAGWGSPSAVHADAANAPPPVSPDQAVVTGTDGVATVSITQAGLWNVRTLYAAGMRGMPERWEVYFATIVFAVNAASPGNSNAGDTEGFDGTGGIGNARNAGAIGDVATVAARNDSADVVATVASFHAALAAGDSGAALGLLSPSVQIIESGGVEDFTHYREHHLPGDISFAKAVKSDRTVTQVTVRGDAAWIVSTSITSGESNGRTINSQGAELAVLARAAQGWKITAFHWSSRARRAGG